MVLNVPYLHYAIYLSASLLTYRETSFSGDGCSISCDPSIWGWDQYLCLYVKDETQEQKQASPFS